nr:hypothetical protein [Nocardia terpenica]
MPQSQHGLDDPDDAGTAFQVPDIRLRGTDHAGSVELPADTEHRGHSLHLGDIPGGRTGSVRLDEGYRPRIDSDGTVGALQQMDLRSGARRHDPVRPPVLMDSSATNDSENTIAVPLRRGESLQNQYARALASSVTVRVCVERFAAAVRRQRTRRVEYQGERRTGHDVDTTDDPDRDLSVPQCLGGQMDGDERRGTRGVDGHTRTAQIETVRDPIGHTAQRRPDTHPCLDTGRVLQHPATVIVARHAHVDPGIGARERARPKTGVFQRFPGGLENDPLLRIHELRFARRDPEELVVETGDVIQEAALANYSVQGTEDVFITISILVPPARRKLGDQDRSGQQCAPELLWRFDPSGQSARHADNGHRIGFRIVRNRIFELIAPIYHIYTPPRYGNLSSSIGSREIGSIRMNRVILISKNNPDQ